ncbi:MAG: B12-binding domain-containing radical SAM protein [Desulfuromonas sp.]|nr:MAG: B12-binding domain-containing radical SAM protein [Desulfuromonas sp.]
MSLDKLNQIERPSRYLGGELGSTTKDLSTVDLRFALAFPDVYEIGMSHLGFAILYHILNDCDWIAAERCYAPWPDMEALLREKNEPLTSLENQLPLNQFDIVGFSLQYELSYTNILNMLDLAGIPRRREQRNGDDPLVVVGGPCAFNPEPIADFFDCAIIGDAEEAVVELCATVREAKKENISRTELFVRLSQIEGVYVPSLFEIDYTDDGSIESIRPESDEYSVVKRRFINDLDAAPFPTKPIVPFMNTVHNRVAMEIARGCTRGCRFCQAGYIYRPVRERSPQKIADLLADSIANSGYEELSLLSLSTGDYSCIEPLLKGLMDRYAEDNVAVSLPSLRVGSLTPELMEQIKKVRKTGFTLAPEAGSERLRKAINKGISEEDLLIATRNAFELGWRLVKLYFMLGLPTETDADLAAIIDIADRAKKTGKGTQGGANINVAVSTFVPKAHTPFQWEAQLSLEETERRQELLKENLKKKKLRCKWHDAPLSMLEGVFARGDRRLSAVLEKAVDLGCRFDGWRDHFRFDLWQQAFADCEIDPNWYLRRRETDETLPWDHIDCGIPKQYLLQEREKAVSGEETPDCRHGTCSQCGVCDFEELRMRYAQAGEISFPPADREEPTADETFRYRMTLRKSGRGRFVGHLEYITLLLRAARRAGLPLRFSGGFHPKPKVSFSDALPTGIASEAELLDLELTRQISEEILRQQLNRQLPEGFQILECRQLYWKTASPSASIKGSTYRLPLTNGSHPHLQERIDQFLQSESIEFTRRKKERPVQFDLRPDVIGIALDGNTLELTLRKGNPFGVIAWLLEIEEEAARQLAVTKTAIIVKETAGQNEAEHEHEN